jgi:hypothetical protein
VAGARCHPNAVGRRARSEVSRPQGAGQRIKIGSIFQAVHKGL